MKRIMLIISYDGTNYCGWQVQVNGITIEEVLNKCLSELLKEKITVIGASRTDSGVHAIGNVAVFDTETKIPAEKIVFVLNQRLPEDIRIQESKEVDIDFHPRKCNSRKTYEYQILNRKFNLPLKRLYSQFAYMPLDVEKMKRAAEYLVGEHDFQSFCSARGQAEDTYRTIYSLDIKKEEDMISIQICGNGFLYNMVRIIVGTLTKVGMGVYPPEYVEEILEAKDRYKAGPKAPAQGLTLVGIEFEKELEDRVEIQNKESCYWIWQNRIKEEKKAVIVIKRCEREVLERLIERNTRKVIRNGAEKVQVLMKKGLKEDGLKDWRIGEYQYSKKVQIGERKVGEEDMFKIIQMEEESLEEWELVQI